MTRHDVRQKVASLITILVLMTVLIGMLLCLGDAKIVTAEEQTATSKYIMEFGGVEVDMSQYAYQDISSSDVITENNIDEYVPTEWFNAENGSIGYVGRNYGFLLEVDGGRNRVLLFTIDYINNFVDDSSLTISISVVAVSASAVPASTIFMASSSDVFSSMDAYGESESVVCVVDASSEESPALIFASNALS